MIRAAVNYAAVWLVLRVAGKGSLAEITTFDFVLLLIIIKTTPAALADKHSSVTSSLLLIVTMVGLDIALSYLKRTSKRVERALESAPLWSGPGRHAPTRWPPGLSPGGRAGSRRPDRHLERRRDAGRERLQKFLGICRGAVALWQSERVPQPLPIGEAPRHPVCDGRGNGHRPYRRRAAGQSSGRHVGFCPRFRSALSE